jgi:hypothetical protein
VTPRLHSWLAPLQTLALVASLRLGLRQPKLFSMKSINLLETIHFVKTTNVEIMDTNVKTSISEQEFEV